MSEKIYVLEDPEEKAFRRSGKRRPSSAPRAKEKNPALSFSLSVMVWGGGQFYNRQYGRGFIFLALMAVFYAGLFLTALYWDAIRYYMKLLEHPFSLLLLSIIVFYFLGLLCWFFNAVQAFYSTRSSRRTPFQGITEPVWAFLSSLVLPGWGQFLNGQPIKGLFFLLFAYAGFTAIPILISMPFVWPGLENSLERLSFERYFAAALIALPFFLFFWLVGVFDAVRVCQDSLKKEPLLKRLEYAYNRVRMQGIIRGLIPQIRITLLLVFILTASTLFAYFYLSERNYLESLQEIRTGMKKYEMVITPKILDRLIQRIQARHKGD